MNVLVACGLSDSKLRAKLEGLVASPMVDTIYLVRRTSVELEKVKCCCPPSWISKSTFLFEVWRFLAILYLAITKRVRLLIGIQAQMHGFVAVFVSQLLGLKSALWLIGSDISIYARVSRFAPLIRYAIRKADTIYVMGDSSKRLVRSTTGRDDRVFIQQVVSKYTGSIGLNFYEKRWDLIFAGNLVGVKNPQFMIPILSKVLESCPSARLCMIGDGVLRRDLMEQIELEGLGSHVDVEGQVPDPLRYIEASKVLVIPSKSEGLPSVLIEAAQVGVPVVATPVGEIPSFGKGCNGIFLAESGDPGSFVQAIVPLITDSKIYSKASESIHHLGQKYCANWSVDTQQKVWEKALL